MSFKQLRTLKLEILKPFYIQSVICTYKLAKLKAEEKADSKEMKAIFKLSKDKDIDKSKAKAEFKANFIKLDIINNSLGKLLDLICILDIDYDIEFIIGKIKLADIVKQECNNDLSINTSISKDIFNLFTELKKEMKANKLDISEL